LELWQFRKQKKSLISAFNHFIFFCLAKSHTTPKIPKTQKKIKKPEFKNKNKIKYQSK
jgi:hypothetical protein